MLIAERMLALRSGKGEVQIPVRVFAPVQKGDSWVCKLEVDWPDGTLAMEAGGVDAIQALHIALQLIGAQLYASDCHAAGKLMWLEPGKGYGFPVPNGIRDMLVGDDKTL